jgi:anti-anti-sigma regulatory factor
MLKVSVLESRALRTLVIEGTLTAPWVKELESIWKPVSEAHGERKTVVDLSGTTVIDASGKAILTAMVGEGVQLVGKGVYTEYLVKKLVDGARRAACRY